MLVMIKRVAKCGILKELLLGPLSIKPRHILFIKKKPRHISCLSLSLNLSEWFTFGIVDAHWVILVIYGMLHCQFYVFGLWVVLTSRRAIALQHFKVRDNSQYAHIVCASRKKWEIIVLQCLYFFKVMYSHFQECQNFTNDVNKYITINTVGCKIIKAQK